MHSSSSWVVLKYRLIDIDQESMRFARDIIDVIFYELALK